MVDSQLPYSVNNNQLPTIPEANAVSVELYPNYRSYTGYELNTDDNENNYISRDGEDFVYLEYNRSTGNYVDSYGHDYIIRTDDNNTRFAYELPYDNNNSNDNVEVYTNPNQYDYYPALYDDGEDEYSIVRDDLDGEPTVYLTYNSDNDTYTDEINGNTYILRTGDFGIQYMYLLPDELNLI